MPKATDTLEILDITDPRRMPVISRVAFCRPNSRFGIMNSILENQFLSHRMGKSSFSISLFLKFFHISFSKLNKRFSTFLSCSFSSSLFQQFFHISFSLVYPHLFSYGSTNFARITAHVPNRLYPLFLADFRVPIFGSLFLSLYSCRPFIFSILFFLPFVN